jgi:hypothetical protein
LKKYLAESACADRLGRQLLAMKKKEEEEKVSLFLRLNAKAIVN